MTTELSSTLDPRFTAKPLGMVRGINSYLIMFRGVPCTYGHGERQNIVPASKVMNELDRCARAYLAIFSA